MNILAELDNPALMLLMGTGVTIGIATGVAYETVRILRSHRKKETSQDETSEQVRILRQMLLHQQHREVQQMQQSLVASLSDLNGDLTRAKNELAMLKSEVDSLRDPTEDK